LKLRNEVMIRLSDVTYEWLLDRAAQKRLPHSAYAREILERAANMDLKQEGHNDDKDAA
jgi:predicted DNA binding CopG/RHH family protein